MPGFVAPGFETVLEVFEANIAEGRDLGAAFAADVDEIPVVRLWGGIARSAGDQPWTENTLVPIFSGTKGLTALCLLILVERGALDLRERVASYWPEFATNGKVGITVREVVSHRSGVPGITTPVSAEQATDGRRMAELIAAQRPATRPGSWHCYHAMTVGWMWGELIRRVDGRTTGRFFADEVAQPLGLDIWIGLPATLEDRVAILEPGKDFNPAHTDWTREQAPIPWSVWRNPPRYDHDGLALNSLAWHQSEIPSTNAIATAASLARMYGCLACGGELDGVRVCSGATIDSARRELTAGFDPYLQSDMRFGTGFQLQTPAQPFGPEPDAFGHTGAGGSVHGAWPRPRVGFSYTPNRLQSVGPSDPRANSLLNALHGCVHSVQ